MLIQLKIHRTEIKSRPDFLLAVTRYFQCFAQVLGSEEQLFGLHVAAAEVVADDTAELESFASASVGEKAFCLMEEGEGLRVLTGFHEFSSFLISSEHLVKNLSV